jgi:hypothetical protein
MNELSKLESNIVIDWKVFPGANTLAYLKKMHSFEYFS